MILDVLSQWRCYEPLHARFARAFAFLEGVTHDTAAGRHEIEGDEVFALVQRYRTQPGPGPQLEVHRRFIDIQYLVAGREVIDWAPLTALHEVTMPYDEAKEAALYAAAATVPVRLATGWFAILFPADAHAPCRAWDEPEEVVKVVVKVAV